MAAATDILLGQNAHNIKPPKRFIPIVPIVPRKFEKKTKPTNTSTMACLPRMDKAVMSLMSDSSAPANGFLDPGHTGGEELINPSEGEKLVEGQEKRPNYPTDSKDTSGIIISEGELEDRVGSIEKVSINFEGGGDLGSGIGMRKNPKSHVEETEKLENGGGAEITSRAPGNEAEEEKPEGHSSSLEITQDGMSYAGTTTDFHSSATKKNGFRLPPSFYPRDFKPLLPSQPQLQLETLPHLQFSSEHANLSYSEYPLTEHPSSYCITTPPTDDNISSTETDYRGYGHISHASMQPDHTPPTDPIPSPTNDSFKAQNQNPETSHSVQKTSPTADGPTSPCSFYQGYTYSNAGPPRTSGGHDPTSIQDLQANSLSPHDDDYMLNASFYGKPHGHFSTGPSRNSSQSKDNGTGMSSTTLRHHAAKIDHSVSESRQSWTHGASPTSSLHSFHQPYQPTGSGLYDWQSFPANESKRESWRSATLSSLTQPITEAPANHTSLTAYLLDQFDNEKYADIRLEVIRKKDGLVMAEFKLHSLLMAQNTLWQELLSHSSREQDGLKLLQLRTNDRFITSQAIEAALRIFYGEPPHLFMGSCLHIDFSKSSTDTALIWMEKALAFAASGYLLGLDEVITRGLHIASSILNWDNIEKALCFALDEGLDPNLDPDHALRVESLLSSTNTSADCIPPAINGVSASRAGLGPGFRTPQSKAGGIRRSPVFLLQCLDYIALQFPMSWDLDVSAYPLAEIDRLPAEAKAHSPSNKSRLSKIRFGDCPPELHSISRHRDSVLSSILLSLPFIPLKHILDQLAEPTRSRIIRSIIDERERRRMQVLKEGDGVWSRWIIDAHTWACLGWEEYVFPTSDSYLAIGRRWTNFYKPNST